MTFCSLLVLHLIKLDKIVQAFNKDKLNCKTVHDSACLCVCMCVCDSLSPGRRGKLKYSNQLHPIPLSSCIPPCIPHPSSNHIKQPLCLFLLQYIQFSIPPQITICTFVSWFHPIFFAFFFL